MSWDVVQLEYESCGKVNLAKLVNFVKPVKTSANARGSKIDGLFSETVHQNITTFIISKYSQNMID